MQVFKCGNIAIQADRFRKLEARSCHRIFFSDWKEPTSQVGLMIRSAPRQDRCSHNSCSHWHTVDTFWVFDFFHILPLFLISYSFLKEMLYAKLITRIITIPAKNLYHGNCVGTTELGSWAGNGKLTNDIADTVGSAAPFVRK